MSGVGARPAVWSKVDFLVYRRSEKLGVIRSGDKLISLIVEPDKSQSHEGKDNLSINVSERRTAVGLYAIIVN